MSYSIRVHEDRVDSLGRPIHATIFGTDATRAGTIVGGEGSFEISPVAPGPLVGVYWGPYSTLSEARVAISEHTNQACQVDG